MVHTMLLASNVIPSRGIPSQLLTGFNFLGLAQEGLQCDVVFGAPSADCRGTGICKISGTNSYSILSQKKECKTTSSILLEVPDNQGITLVFFRSLLCSQLYRHHFWKGILKMAEACPLPAEIQTNLKSPYTCLLPGDYKVVEHAGWFQVDVDCAI